MKTQVTFTKLFLAGIAAVVLVFSAVVVVGGAAFAQEALDGEGNTGITAPFDRGQRGGPDGFRGGPGGFDGHRGPLSDRGLVDHDALLAEALGITVEELTAAKDEAKAQSLSDAVAAGVITQEEADAILAEDSRPDRETLRALRDWHRDSETDKGVSLADALGISVEDLEAAREAAKEAGLAEMIDAGVITQEHAELMQAGQALKDYVDREAMLADVLGLTVEELETAKADGTRLPELIEAAGLDYTTFRDNMAAAMEANVAQAVADGVITQEQADQLQEMGGKFLKDGRPGKGGPGHHGPRGGDAPFNGPPADAPADGSGFTPPAGPGFGGDDL